MRYYGQLVRPADHNHADTDHLRQTLTIEPGTDLVQLSPATVTDRYSPARVG